MDRRRGCGHAVGGKEAAVRPVRVVRSPRAPQVPPRSGSKGAQLVPDAVPTLPGDSAGEFPARVTSPNDIVPGKPLLTDEALGWLAFLDRKTTFDGSWFKDDNVHPSWDNYTGAPIGVYHRYDLS